MTDAAPRNEDARTESPLAPSFPQAMEIAAQAKLEGVSDLRESGLRKVKQGLTTIEEVLGCTNA
jgi:type II secretory ATPase GspE/PulE/Tfp pilus assembly ATPase PilB-like protein